MTLLGLTAGAWRCEVNALGAGLSQLSYDGRDVVERQDGRVGAPSFHGAVLAPWPGRIDAGRYERDGVRHQLEVNEPERDVALHGLVVDTRWDVTSHAPDTVTLVSRLKAAPGYPFTLALRVRYTVSATGLSVTLSARNVGTGTAPYGCGFHPYVLGVASKAGAIDGTVLRFDAGEQLELDPDRLLPRTLRPFDDRSFAGTGRALGGTTFDDAFRAVLLADDGRTRLAFGDVRLWWDDALPWMQLYTPSDRSALAVEPYSCASDAFNTCVDLVLLAPGESHTATWGIAVH